MMVGIAGLGLIGGSMAKSIKKHTTHTVYGIDRNHETMELAQMSGAIDGTLTDETLSRCDLVLTAMPPHTVVEWVREHASQIDRSATLVDLCGVKRTVVAELAPIAERHGFGYIGGHPMAGRECSGFVSATDDLYEGASMILTPDKRTDPLQLEEMKAFFLSIGFAKLTFSNPEEHDRIIAYTSQLAHITSSAYVKSPEAQRRRGFSAGSFKDMTRVARLDAKLWTELLLDNADFLTAELDTLITHLTEYQTALRNHNKDELHLLLEEGRDKKTTAGGT